MDIEEIRKQAIGICKNYRKSNKLTQQQLADKAGVSKRSIHSVEHGVTVYGDTLQKVLGACGWNYRIEMRHFLEKDKQDA